MHTSMLGIVVPMDTDACTIAAEWVEWDLRLLLWYLSFAGELVAELPGCFNIIFK